MTRLLPLVLGSLLCYTMALAFGVQATLYVLSNQFGAAFFAWLQWLFSTVLMYVFGALAWVTRRANRGESPKVPAFRGW